MHPKSRLPVLGQRDRRPCEAVPAKGLGHAPSQVVLPGTQAGYLCLEARVGLQLVEDRVGLEKGGRKGGTRCIDGGLELRECLVGSARSVSARACRRCDV